MPDDTPLATLRVLAIDCQATGASPRHGHLLEIAWASADATDAAPPTAHLIALPGGHTIPAQIARLTGITPDLLASASPLPPAEAVAALLADAAALPRQPAVVIAHVARYERGFLEAHAAALPLELLCTHEIARRLLPDLPRRGLRALAGFLGDPLPHDLKRAAEHVTATADIWRHLVRRLRDDLQITTLSALHDLLTRKAPKSSGKRLTPVERDVRLSLPASPGVYRMLNAQGRVLYVGKATSLKSRVNSYFQSRRGTSSKNLELITQVWSLDTTPTATPLEAALLENDEIKRLDPPYNVALKPILAPLVFASATLGATATAPDARHPLGPLDAATPARLLCALASALGAGDAGEGLAGERLRAALELPEAWAPEAATALDGLHLLRQTWALPSPCAPSHLRALGLRLHRLAVAAREEARQGGQDASAGEALEDEEAPAAPEGGFVWTAEAVAQHLAELTRYAAHRLRRAAWLAQLAESSVLWAPRSRRERDRRRVLVLEHGVVIEAFDAEGSLPPAPPSGGLRHLERLLLLRREAVERLKVLSTELRRLVAEERLVVVRLGERRTLDAARLRRLFQVV